MTYAPSGTGQNLVNGYFGHADRNVPITRDINEWWSLTVHHADKLGSKNWRAKATLWCRDTNHRVGEPFYGVGTTMLAADDDAASKAEEHALRLGRPDDWVGEGDRSE